jgi:hypothetical protein
MERKEITAVQTDPGSYVRDIVGSDQQVYGDDRTTSKSNSI